MNAIGPYYLWGNGASFDLAILDSAYRACGIGRPWTYSVERCVRTLSALKPDIRKNTPFEGVQHNAIADCKHQIKYCSKVWNSLNLVSK